MRVTVHLKKSLFAISLILIALSLFVSSIATQAPLTNIIIAHLAFVLLLALYYIISDVGVRRELFWTSYWLLPVIIPMLFLVLWTSALLPQSLDGPNIFVLQLLGSLIISIIGLTQLTSDVTEKKTKPLHEEYAKKEQVYKEQAKHLAEQIPKQKELYAQQTQEYEAHLKQLLAQKEHAEELARKATERNQTYASHLTQLQQSVDQMKNQLAITQQNFTARLRGVEDKCKAINYVIGRVYSDKNGGSQEIREQLGVNRELYNAFSDQTQEIMPESVEPLIDILEQIYEKIIQLEKEEETVIMIPKRKQNLIARKAGDTVLEILSRNDKDPIIDYVSEAKEVCSKMLAYLTNQKV